MSGHFADESRVFRFDVRTSEIGRSTSARKDWLRRTRWAEFYRVAASIESSS